jgi:release factor family 10
MRHPTLEDARRLADWRPPLGVISIYLRFDPADRGGAWRTELRNGLAAVEEAGDRLDHETRTALRATVKRVSERFGNHERGLPRGEVGFVEVATGRGEQRWWATHLFPRTPVSACYAERPVIAPLLCLAEHGAPRGVALLSAERVRLLEWAPGTTEDLENWELSVFSRDWRERKAPRIVDPARGQGVSAAGHDQFEERLAENRERFLAQCGRLAARIGSKRAWAQLLVFGAAEHVRDFLDSAVSSGPPVETAEEADLISTPDGKLEARLEEAATRLTAARERGLIERALEEARGGNRGTAGAQETLAALKEGRVDHLILDAARAASACSSPALSVDPDESDDGPGSEAMARCALAEAAKVTAVSDEAASLLAPVGGVAALLRY